MLLAVCFATLFLFNGSESKPMLCPCTKEISPALSSEPRTELRDATSPDMKMSPALSLKPTTELRNTTSPDLTTTLSSKAANRVLEPVTRKLRNVTSYTTLSSTTEVLSIPLENTTTVFPIIPPDFNNETMLLTSTPDFSNVTVSPFIDKTSLMNIPVPIAATLTGIFSLCCFSLACKGAKAYIADCKNKVTAKKELTITTNKIKSETKCCEGKHLKKKSYSNETCHCNTCICTQYK
ncbi:uncharacterized protein [Parasteatoda tepidariorum]